MKVSIEHYLASNNPMSVNQLLQKNGLKNQVDVLGMIKGLQFLINKKGNAIVSDLADIDTPYKSLILAKYLPSGEIKSNACGCSGFNGEEKSNCAGCVGKCGGMSNATGDAVASNPASDSKKDNSQPSDLKTWAVPALLTGILIAVIAKGK